MVKSKERMDLVRSEDAMVDETATVKQKRGAFDRHSVIAWSNVYAAELGEKQNR